MAPKMAPIKLISDQQMNVPRTFHKIVTKILAPHGPEFFLPKLHEAIARTELLWHIRKTSLELAELMLKPLMANTDCEPGELKVLAWLFVSLEEIGQTAQGATAEDQFRHRVEYARLIELSIMLDIPEATSHSMIIKSLAQFQPKQIGYLAAVKNYQWDKVLVYRAKVQGDEGDDGAQSTEEERERTEGLGKLQEGENHEGAQITEEETEKGGTEKVAGDKVPWLGRPSGNNLSSRILCDLNFSRYDKLPESFKAMIDEKNSALENELARRRARRDPSAEKSASGTEEGEKQPTQETSSGAERLAPGDEGEEDHATQAGNPLAEDLVAQHEETREYSPQQTSPNPEEVASEQKEPEEDSPQEQLPRPDWQSASHIRNVFKDAKNATTKGEFAQFLIPLMALTASTHLSVTKNFSQLWVDEKRSEGEVDLGIFQRTKAGRDYLNAMVGNFLEREVTSAAVMQVAQEMLKAPVKETAIAEEKKTKKPKKATGKKKRAKAAGNDLLEGLYREIDIRSV